MKNAFLSRLAVPIFGVILFVAFPSNVRAQSLNEESLKASYILKFIDFVRWERPTSNPTKVGVVHDPSLFRELQAIAAKKSRATRSFEIVEIDTSSDKIGKLSGLDLVYIGRNQQPQWAGIVKFARQESIITVSSEPGFLEEGGLIEFITLQNRIRFSLNLVEVDLYNLGVSSKLAQLSVK
ncbi:YfiR family protein [Pelagicoccus sp. SDUM812002]|uniref:YfiR family protein n=1 Tax=Pelagicoccus sp. SDUM812002 TaxID=3041266 RepID=UPI0028106CEC|nr:YfiR family protein [Pelagicoccus sp. SDUM812002]MDQ8186044.1 YfiR family protein [Pelagicoccus sp. SDUM812002]